MLGSLNSNFCEVLDITNPDAVFESITERPKVQTFPQILVLKNQVWLFGGHNTANVLISIVQRYDIATNKWTAMADLKCKINLRNPCLIQSNEVLIYSVSGKLLEQYKLDQL